MRFGGAMSVAAFGAFMAIAVPASASVITYDFTAESGHYGSFSYDNENTTTVEAPPSTSWFGVWYDAISISIDGSAIAAPVVGIYDNYHGSYDCLTLISGFGRAPAFFQFCGLTTVFSSAELSVADNLQFADFTVENRLTTYSYPISTFKILTLTQRSVPEPGALALLSLGLAGLAASRRRKQ